MSVAHRFFWNHPFNPEQELVLSPEESYHLSKVLRILIGSEIEIFDGRGARARALVLESSPKQSRVRVIATEFIEKRSKISLCFGVPKATALEFVLRRATEIGVESFQPLLTQYSLSLHSWNTTRWQKILVEVCKQSEQCYLPDLSRPLALEDWLNHRSKERSVVFCNERERLHQKPINQNDQGFDLVIGPEGGWSPQECKTILAEGAVLLGLGPYRLRTETAALVATTLLKKQIGEL